MLTVLLNWQMSLHRKQRILKNSCGSQNNLFSVFFGFRNPILDFLKERDPNFQIVWGELQKKSEKTRKDLEDKMVNVVDELKKT